MRRIYCFNFEISLLHKTMLNAFLNLWLVKNSFGHTYSHIRLAKTNTAQHCNVAHLLASSLPLPPLFLFPPKQANPYDWMQTCIRTKGALFIYLFCSCVLFYFQVVCGGAGKEEGCMEVVFRDKCIVPLLKIA